jgi:hypothetical protein
MVDEMGTDHFFAQLQAHATKLYKFQQRKSVPHGTGDQWGGACLAITLVWIHEKTTTSNSFLLRPFQHREFVSSASGDIHAHNAHISGTANMYRRDLVHGGDISPIERAIGLVPLNSSTAEIKRTRGAAPPYSPEVDFAGTLVNTAYNLHAGYAVCLEIGLFYSGKPEGHAIGMYKSRGGTLHFFCPNAGEYDVINPEGFFEAYIAGCEQRGWQQLYPLVRRGDEGAWCHFYSR